MRGTASFAPCAASRGRPSRWHPINDSRGLPCPSCDAARRGRRRGCRPRRRGRSATLKSERSHARPPHHPRPLLLPAAHQTVAAALVATAAVAASSEVSTPAGMDARCRRHPLATSNCSRGHRQQRLGTTQQRWGRLRRQRRRPHSRHRCVQRRRRSEAASLGALNPLNLAGQRAQHPVPAAQLLPPPRRRQPGLNTQPIGPERAPVVGPTLEQNERLLPPLTLAPAPQPPAPQ